METDAFSSELNTIRLQLQSKLLGHQDLIIMCSTAYAIMRSKSILTAEKELRMIRALIELKLIMWQEPTDKEYEAPIKEFLIKTRDNLDAKIGYPDPEDQSIELDICPSDLNELRNLMGKVGDSYLLKKKNHGPFWPTEPFFD